MPAGRPHEVAGNGGPRWMTVASRQREGTEPGLQAGSPLYIIVGSLSIELDKYMGVEVIKEFGEVVVTTLEQFRAPLLACVEDR